MPPITPTSYEALAVSYAIEMLAASATFQTLVDADDATEAKAFIVNGVGGLPSETGSDDDEQLAINTLGTSLNIDGTTAWAVVSSESFEVEPIALREFIHRGEIEIVGTVPLLADELPNDLTTRGRNVMGAIRSEIEAQFGTAGKLMGRYVTCAGPSRPDETGARRGSIDFKITIHWSDVI